MVKGIPFDPTDPEVSGHLKKLCIGGKYRCIGIVINRIIMYGVRLDTNKGGSLQNVDLQICMSSVYILHQNFAKNLHLQNL